MSHSQAPSTDSPTPTQPSSLRKRLLRAGTATAMGKVVATFAVLLNYRLLSNCLPDDEVATFLVINGIAALGALAAGLGLGPLVMRRIRTCQLRRDDALTRTTLLRAISLLLPATAAAAIAVGCLLKLQPSLFGTQVSEYGLYAAVWLVGITMCLFLADALRGYERFGTAALISGLNGGMLPNLIVTLYLLTAGSAVESAASVITVQVAAHFLAAAIGVTRLTPRKDRQAAVEVAHRLDRPESTQAMGMLSEGLPILVNQLSVIGITHFEVLLLGMYAPAEDVAAYGAVRRLMLLVGSPLMLLNASLPTFVVELFTQNKKQQLQQLLRGAATASLIPAGLLLLVISLAPKECLSFFDPEYQDAWPALLILAGANLVFVLAGSCGLTLRMTGFERWSMASGLASGILYLLIAPWAAAHYSLLGIAVATATLLVARNVVGVILVRQLVGVWCTPWITIGTIRDAFRQLINRGRRPSTGSLPNASA